MRNADYPVVSCTASNAESKHVSGLLRPKNYEAPQKKLAYLALPVIHTLCQLKGSDELKEERDALGPLHGAEVSDRCLVRLSLDLSGNVSGLEQTVLLAAG